MVRIPKRENSQGTEFREGRSGSNTPPSGIESYMEKMTSDEESRTENKANGQKIDSDSERFCNSSEGKRKYQKREDGNFESKIPRGIQFSVGNNKYILLKSFSPSSASSVVKWYNSSNLFYCSGSSDGTVAIYNADTQKTCLRFKTHKSGGLTDFRWSSSNEHLITTSALERVIRVWNVPNRKKIATISVDEGVSAIAWHPLYKNKFVCGDMSGNLFLYSSSSLVFDSTEHVPIVQSSRFFGGGHDLVAPITCLEFASNRHKDLWMFTGNAMGRLVTYKYLFSQEDGYFSYQNHISLSSNISHIIYSSRYKSLLVNSTDNKIKLYSFPDLELKKVFFHPHRVTPIRCCLTPDGNGIMTGSEDGCIRIFCLQTGRLLEMVSVHACRTIPITSVAISGDGKYVISGSVDGIVNLYKLSVVS
eukprot:TRINITY_DN2611_c0_g2_i1.p1 TRINITY_DN2611_c0_g2~~TRINITY_DN2611_c0_g2_i1.p1  ORF type:complete len:419 (-),score=83.26 TRINITY_DN2611_c0_g2_i1:402-1658(-)